MRARAAFGFIIAPLFPGMVAWSFVMATNINNLPSIGTALVLLLDCLILSAELGYGIAILLGLPLFYVMTQRGVGSLWTYALAALFMGILPYAELSITSPSVFLAALFIPSTSDTDWLITSQVPLSCIPIGIVASLIAVFAFRLIVRPDQINIRPRA